MACPTAGGGGKKGKRGDGPPMPPAPPGEAIRNTNLAKRMGMKSTPKGRKIVKARKLKANRKK